MNLILKGIQGNCAKKWRKKNTLSIVAYFADSKLVNIPSVNVDVEGNVSLRGDSGVQILVDGKVSGLAGVSTQDALRSLQADMIERIEVVTNPSVRYDAEGTAGIINIVLKKDKRKGFNASVDVRGGFPVQWGEKLFKKEFPLKNIFIFSLLCGKMGGRKKKEVFNMVDWESVVKVF